MKTCSVRSKRCAQYQSQKYYHETNDEPNPIILTLSEQEPFHVTSICFWITWNSEFLMNSDLLETEGSRLTVINCVIFIIIFKLFFLPFSNVPVPKSDCYVKQIIACIYFTVSLLVYYKYIRAKFIVFCRVFYKHWRNFGFFCSINHLVDLLGNKCLLEQVQKVMVCDLW